MKQKAKVFTNGRSQAVRLPAAFRFDTKEVFIRRDDKSGDVILSRRPDNWDSFFELRSQVEIPPDFLDPASRNQGTHRRDLFEDWKE